MFQLRAFTRTQLSSATYGTVSFIISPILAGGSSLDAGSLCLARWIDHAFQSLAGAEANRKRRVWIVLVPLLWLALFIATLGGNLYIAGVTGHLGPYAGSLLASPRPSSGAFSVFLVASASLCWSLALLELRRPHVLHPWSSLDNRDRRFLAGLSARALTCDFGAGLVLLGAYELTSWLTPLFWVLVMPPLLGGAMLAGWAALSSPATLLIALLFLLRLQLSIIRAPLHAIVQRLDAFTHASGN
jgi:hypothetical protein